MRNVENTVPLALRVEGIAPVDASRDAPERSAPVPDPPQDGLV